MAHVLKIIFMYTSVKTIFIFCQSNGLPTSYEVKLVQIGDISEQNPSLTLILQKGKFMLLCVGKVFHLKTT